MDLTFDYTHKNHFKFGYVWKGYYESPEGTEEYDSFDVGYGRCSYIPTDFRSECYRSARLIAESTDEIPNILFSGGMESEIIVRSFRDQDLPFRVSIMQFENNLNLHDIAFAVVFCEQDNISYDIFTLDLIKFFDGEAMQYAENTFCCSPQLLPTMWLADQIVGLPILGSGDPYVRKDLPSDYISGESPYESSKWFFEEKEKIQSWYRHFFQAQRPAIPGFFQYTPELMYSFLSNPVIRELVADRREGKISTVSTKNEFYLKWFPEMNNRSKFTGYEKVPELEATMRAKLTERFGQYDRAKSIEYHWFLENLRYVG